MNGDKLNIGVDVGGTNIKFGVTSGDGKILFQHKIATEAARGSAAVIQSIIEGVAVLLSKAGLSRADVRSLGLGIPGTTDSRNGIVVFAPNLFWRNVEVARTIREACDVPVYAAQDTRAAVWGEYLVGAGKGLRSVASITLGTGIGCGMVIDGKIFHGALNTAGEFGHQIVEPNGHGCNCGRFGCLEAYAGGLAIVREAKSRIAALTGEVAVHDVFRLAQQGNREARQITGDVVKYVGMGLVNLINITSPELVSISGGISNAPDELLLHPLLAFVKDRAYESISKQVVVCRSSLGDDAPMIGASLLHREGLRQVA